MRQAVVRDQRGDVRQLGLLRPQEFLPRRHVVEQVANRDLRAGSQRRLLAPQHLPAHDLDQRPGLLLASPRLEQQPRDRSDRRQRLPAESQSRDVEQIACARKLAGGVPLERQHGVVVQHAAAIVGDANQAPPPAGNFDPHPRGPGVERVLEQLLDHRSWPLHHLPRRDLIGDLVGQDADAPHAVYCSSESAHSWCPSSLIRRLP